MISQKFKASLKLADRPAYRIAQDVGVNPNDLSKIIRGILPTKKNDPRVIAVGKILGLKPEECFQEDGNQ